MSWIKTYPDGQVSLAKQIEALSNDYQEIFKKKSKCVKKIENVLSTLVRNNMHAYPFPDKVFRALELDISDIRVVILGQDPYHSVEVIKGNVEPQAMGLSFSVSKQHKIPSSLKNVYKNLLKYNHLKTSPSHGDLTNWFNQGCMLLNTALTVQNASPNSHREIWPEITDEIIKYISGNTENIVFVLWGKNALGKKKYINEDKHKIIISSHPSGLSYSHPMDKYPPFSDIDHFGEINKYLEENNRGKIDWTL